MTVAVLIVFATCIVGGIGLTFHTDLAMRAEERFFAGWIIGIVAFTCCGIVSTRLFDFNGPAVAVAAVATLAASTPGWRHGLDRWRTEVSELRARLALPLRSGQNPIVLLGLLVPLWLVIGRMFHFAYQGAADGGILAGHLAAWTDWQAHLTYTASFAFADNTDLNLAVATGNDIGYHAGINYFAALLVPAGASLPGALQLSGAFTLFAFPGVMYGVGMRIFDKQATALLGTGLFLLFGGWGWTEFIGDLRDDGVDVLRSLPRTYTRAPEPENGSWWIENPIVGHFFPQRPTLLGFPVVLIVMSWLASAWFATVDDGRDMRRTFLFCGVLVGLVPFFNLFAFGTPLAFAGLWWIFTRFRREWLHFLVPAVVLALPVVLYLQPPTSSIEYPYDWVTHVLHPGGIPDDLSLGTRIVDWIVFWARNLGVFLPLLAAAFVVKGVMPRRIAIGLLPLWLWFIVPNAVKPHPWDGNNTHYFVFVILLGALPVASLLVGLVERRPPAAVVVGPLVLTMILSGALDVFATNDRDTSPYPTLAMDGAGVAVGEWARTTDPDSVFVIELGWSPGAVSPHLHPVPALSGRDVVVGFDGWVYDLGIPDWNTRKQHSQIILEAGPGHEQLLDTYDVDYLVVGPTQRTPSWDPNYAFWEEAADVVYRHAGWIVYEV